MTSPYRNPPPPAQTQQTHAGVNERESNNLLARHFQLLAHNGRCKVHIDFGRRRAVVVHLTQQKNDIKCRFFLFLNCCDFLILSHYPNNNSIQVYTDLIGTIEEANAVANAQRVDVIGEAAL